MYRIFLRGARPDTLFKSSARYFSSTVPPLTLERPSRLTKYARRAAYISLGFGAGYVADRELYASTITRNTRTFWTCAMIALDYKLNFTPEKSESISSLHERVGERLLNLFSSNGGLYIKFGQAIGANAALLPPPIQAKFSRLFDDAPQVPYSVIARTFEAEFGRPPSGPNGIFAEFEETAVASASIAQVHRARLKREDGTPGEVVAVKVQKPAVAKQMEPDLAAFGLVMKLYEYFFDLPAYFVVDFISDHMRQELDFQNEARNGARTAEFVSQDPTLADRVYIPKTYPEFTTKRVLTAEWIDGVRMSDRASIQRLMGDVQALPTSMQPLGKPLSGDLSSAGPLKGGVRWIMQTMVDLFGAQIFRWGWVHCDPHPGNIFIRPHPGRPGQPQLVLLDHGLYVRLNPEFQRQYAQLWKGLLAVDLGTVEKVVGEWGIGAPDLFARATLMRPMAFGKKKKKEDGVIKKKMTQYEASVAMKERLKSFLLDTDKMPKELIFIGRNMRISIVQGNNQMFGSPVNRIKITGYAAADALPRAPQLSARQRAWEYLHQGVFYTVMFSTDVAFWASHARKWVTGARGGNEGFEDELEKQIVELAKTQYGVEIDPASFNA
ncbi:ABC1-domain-containing protein [Artomyces pyxidatus]|uniref:ABC1-domain-containing protein n=1 Tax=Artomyces pyxidatus TaxID=48021 RepID=A0ACB8SXU4_9AGAM|nr:ABC1-domain-containing protein [Artomyces pyxidatus]